MASDRAHDDTVRWNEARVADVELAGWTPVAFDLPDIALDTNLPSIAATPRRRGGCSRGDAEAVHARGGALP